MAGERDGVYRRRLTGGRREHRTVIKHTDEEWARVQAMAQAQGISVPRLYERALHAGDVVAAAKLTELVGEVTLVQRIVAGAAVNLNQLAKVANATGEVAAPQVLAAAEHLSRQTDRLRESLRLIPGGDLFRESR